jgi:hypothetical protein
MDYRGSSVKEFSLSRYHLNKTCLFVPYLVTNKNLALNRPSLPNKAGFDKNFSQDQFI